jgi:hypothetical protein
VLSLQNVAEKYQKREILAFRKKILLGKAWKAWKAWAA